VGAKGEGRGRRKEKEKGKKRLISLFLKFAQKKGGRI